MMVYSDSNRNMAYLGLDQMTLALLEVRLQGSQEVTNLCKR